MAYIHRVLEQTIERYLKAFPVLGVTGPRQSGKSTMLKELLGGSFRYVSFDDYKMIDLFHNDPEKFMRIYSEKTIFDEIQKVPEISNYIKLAVDTDRTNYGRFVVTGSSQFPLMKKVSESLAGRIGLLSLLPFQFSEIPKKVRADAVFRGAYPEIVVRGYQYASEWYSSYLETYLSKDVRELSNIGDMREFRRCLQLLAARTTQILNMSELSRELGVTVATIKKWISVLEASYIIFLLPPFYRNLGKRIVKSPKVYFFDTGIVSFLTGIANADLFEKGPMQGPLFENYVISEVYKRELHTKSNAELYYYRTSHGVEVDLIIDRKQSRDFLEVKSSETFRPEMVKPIEQIKKKDEHGFLVYRGRDLDYTQNLKILNYSRYLA